MLLKDVPFTKNFSLINLLQSFEKKELERLYLLITSPYFNTDQFVIKLYNTLKKYILKKSNFDELIQFKVYKAVFGIEKTDSSVLTKAQKKRLWIKMSVLNNLTRRFLAIEALKDNEAQEIALLHQQLLKKKQYKTLARLVKKKQIQLEKQTIKDEKYYESVFQVEKSNMNMLYQTGTIIKKDNFSRVNDCLDMRYLVHKLKLCATMHSIANINVQKDYDFKSINTIIQLVHSILPNDTPLVQLYLTGIELVKNYQEEAYLQLLQLLEQYSGCISKATLFDFYNIACNFCIIKIRQGKSNYYEEMLKLFKVMDKENLLIVNGFIQVTTLKNIIITGCRLGQFDWSTMIANKYKNIVAKNYQQGAYYLNLGIIEFYKKNFQQAITYLIQVDKLKTPILLDSRMILLRSYYELDKNYDERTVQVFRSTDLFVRNHKKLPATRKRSYKNFIQLLINLYRVRHKVGKQTNW